MQVYGVAKAYRVGPGKRKSIAIVIPKLACGILQVTENTHFVVSIQGQVITLHPLQTKQSIDEHSEAGYQIDTLRPASQKPSGSSIDV